MPTHSIDSIDAVGIGCHLAAKSSATIGWSEITSIGAFIRCDKDGDFTCIWIRAPKVEFPVELDARDPKWAELVAAMTGRLTGFRSIEKWFPTALHPLLEINMQNIYEREPNQITTDNSGASPLRV